MPVVGANPNPDLQIQYSIQIFVKLYLVEVFGFGFYLQIIHVFGFGFAGGGFVPTSGVCATQSIDFYFNLSIYRFETLSCTKMVLFAKTVNLKMLGPIRQVQCLLEK